MKKNIAISVITVGLLSSVSVFGAEDLSTMFSEGKTSGQLREFSITRAMDYTNSATKDYTRSANAVGGFLKYETAAYNGLSFGTAFYTTNGFGLGGDKTAKEVDATLLGTNNESYSILGEAYLQYKYEKTTFKGGRQKLDTPMAGSDDTRMLPSLFEAYVLTNTSISGVTLMAAHATKFAEGTFGRAYSATPASDSAGKIFSATGGYSAYDSKSVGDFKNMGAYAVGQNTKGVSIASVTYAGVENLKVQLWDYYAYDILNVVYGQIDYSMSIGAVKPFVAAQIIKENDVGDKYAGAINSMLLGGKVGAIVENFTAYVAYSQTGANDAADTTGTGNFGQKNAIITPWGGMPAFTQGMVTRHMDMAGTKATKASASYNWKTFGPDLSTELYYINFSMADNNVYTYGDAKESGFDVIYKPAAVKNLSLRARANYADDFKVYADKSTLSWDEYRVIVNYNF